MSNHSGISRRGFVAGAGIVAGAGFAVGAAAATAPLGAAVATTRAYSQLTIAVEIDGAMAGFVNAAEGGGVEARFVSEAIGANKFSKRQLAGVTNLPLTLRFTSLAGAKFPEWLAARDNVPRTVSLALLDTTFTEVYRITLNRARIAGVRTLPFDAMSPTGAPLETEVVLIAENTAYEMGGAKKRAIGSTIKPKVASIAAFRLFFAGLEKATPGIFKIDSIAATSDRVILATGAFSTASSTTVTGNWKAEPVKFRVLLDSAAPFYQWFNTPEEKSGQLQWLATDMQVPATIDFFGAVVSKISTPFSSGAAAPAVDVEVLCTDLKFNYGGVIG